MAIKLNGPVTADFTALGGVGGVTYASFSGINEILETIVLIGSGISVFWGLYIRYKHGKSKGKDQETRGKKE